MVDLISSLVRHKKFGKYGFGGQTGPKYGVGITHLLNETCTILRELLYDIPTLAHLSTIGSIHFINLIVDSLMGIDNADTACTLLEEIVAYRTKTFLLSNINNFEQIVMTLSLRQLSLFMRIFAILIFEPENKNDDVENHGDGDIEVTLNDGTKYLVHPDKIRGGGPPKDGIPSIDNPKFVIDGFKTIDINQGNIGDCW